MAEMDPKSSPAKLFKFPSNLNRIFLGIIIGSVLLGTGTGIYLAKSAKNSATNSPDALTATTAKSAQQDTKTFRDFAEGTIKPIPAPKNNDDYVEGTHLLVRDDNPTPVTLTSSVVDLTQYEGKKVKVYGETQKAVKAGWLMDVGRVEEVK